MKAVSVRMNVLYASPGISADIILALFTKGGGVIVASLLKGFSAGNCSHNHSL